MAAAPPRDYYDVLSVPRDATDDQIKKAFRVMARELHPDVNRHDPEAEEKFKEVAEAYEVLSDPERRQVYDRYGHDGLRSGGYAPNFGDFTSVTDLFSAFFGGADPFGGRGVQGGDVGVEVEITLQEAATGVTRDVSFDAVELCEHCHGNGAEPGTPIETCERCGGAGQLRKVSQTAFGQFVRTQWCEVCGGDGKVAREPCTGCHGQGRRAAQRTLAVDVPAGIEDGQRIRISGAGHAGDGGGPSGDLYVLASVLPDPRFERHGDDLVTAVDLAAPAAALGRTASVPTLDGETELEIPPGTQPGETFKLRGLGMPSLRGRGRRGDLHVVANVIIPQNLSAEQRELLKRFAETVTEENLARRESLLGKIRRALG